MKIIATLAVALIASAFTAGAAEKKCSTGSCSPSAAGGKKVVLDGKVVTVASCKYTRGVRSVRLVKVR